MEKPKPRGGNREAEVGGVGLLRSAAEAGGVGLGSCGEDAEAEAEMVLVSLWVGERAGAGDGDE